MVSKADHIQDLHSTDYVVDRAPIIGLLVCQSKIR